MDMQTLSQELDSAPLADWSYDLRDLSGRPHTIFMTDAQKHAIEANPPFTGWKPADKLTWVGG